MKDGQTRFLFQRDDIPGFNDLVLTTLGVCMWGRFGPIPLRKEHGRPANYGVSIVRDNVVEMYGNVGLTNGIGFSPDGKTIYHADSAGPHIIVHDVAPDGTMSNRRAIAQMTGGTIPDGLCVDEAGCLWVAVYGGRCATRYTPDGKVDRKVDVPAKAVTSVCFGGKDRRDLYIVTADNTEDPNRKGTIFRTRVDVAGVPAPLARV